MLKTVFDPGDSGKRVRSGTHLQDRCCRQRRGDYRHDPDSSQLPRRRLHHGRCPPEDRIDRRRDLRTINLVFEPEWDKDMMSEEAKLEPGLSLTDNVTKHI